MSRDKSQEILLELWCRFHLPYSTFVSALTLFQRTFTLEWATLFFYFGGDWMDMCWWGVLNPCEERPPNFWCSNTRTLRGRELFSVASRDSHFRCLQDQEGNVNERSQWGWLWQTGESLPGRRQIAGPYSAGCCCMRMEAQYKSGLLDFPKKLELCFVLDRTRF